MSDPEITSQVVFATVTEQPLEELLAEARATTSTAQMGAVVTFEGIVRDHDQGNSVSALSYSFHPSASEVINQIAAEVAHKHAGVRVWAAHRVGDLQVGDMAFLVIAASAHRAGAFGAATDLVDEVKDRLPIWKEQTLSDGKTQWVGTE